MAETRTAAAVVVVAVAETRVVVAAVVVGTILVGTVVAVAVSVNWNLVGSYFLLPEQAMEKQVKG